MSVKHPLRALVVAALLALAAYLGLGAVGQQHSQRDGNTEVTVIDAPRASGQVAGRLLLSPS